MAIAYFFLKAIKENHTVIRLDSTVSVSFVTFISWPQLGLYLYFRLCVYKRFHSAFLCAVKRFFIFILSANIWVPTMYQNVLGFGSRELNMAVFVLKECRTHRQQKGKSVNILLWNNNNWYLWTVYRVPGIGPWHKSFSPPKVVTAVSYEKAKKHRKVNNLPKFTLLVASNQACIRRCENREGRGPSLDEARTASGRK